MTLYFVTGNEHKFGEIQKEIPDLERLSIDLPEIQSMNPKEVVRAKLLAAREHHDDDFIVEDVSFHMDALNGLPGPFIKFFLEAVGREGLVRIAEKLGASGAGAVCTIGLLQGDAVEFFQGEITGDVVPARGESGFGWDPVFRPAGYSKTFAEMPTEEKNKISHRGKAVEKLKAFLQR